jgi:hypothetical protein
MIFDIDGPKQGVPVLPARDGYVDFGGGIKKIALFVDTAISARKGVHDVVLALAVPELDGEKGHGGRDSLFLEEEKRINTPLTRVQMKSCSRRKFIGIRHTCSFIS